MPSLKGHSKHGASSSKPKHKASRSQYTGYAQVQNVKSAHVYMFGNNDFCEEDIDSEDEDIELFSMRSRHSTNLQPKKPEPIIFERQISEDDTLRAIALQYSCSISELRRMNHLMSDQDFYALRTIRIPIQPYSILTEDLNCGSDSHSAAGASASIINETVTTTEPGAAGCVDDDTIPDNYLSDPDVQDRVIRSISIRENTQYGINQEARKFLRNMDIDLENIRKTTPLQKASLDDVTLALTSKSIRPLKKESGQRICGFLVPWYAFVIVILLVIFIVVPTVVFIYHKNFHKFH